MTFVKICGITNENDAFLAADLGADALGFNFYSKSPRFVGVERAAKIVSGMKGRVLAVGVFVNMPFVEVLAVARETDIDVIQLHGTESPEYVKEVRDRWCRQVIKAFRIDPNWRRKSFDEYDVEAFLLDSNSPGLFGGSGVTTDWNEAASAARSHPKVFLAGGLTPENVGSAIKVVRPYAVDTASGVETMEKGKKDPKKLNTFIRNAKNS